MAPLVASSSKAKALKASYELVVNNFLAVVAVASLATVLRTAGIDGLYGQLQAARPVHVLTAVILAAALVKLRRVRRPRDVYLVEYGCFRPKPWFRAPYATCLEHVRLMPYLAREEDVA